MMFSGVLHCLLPPPANAKLDSIIRQSKLLMQEKSELSRRNEELARNNEVLFQELINAREELHLATQDFDYAESGWIDAACAAVTAKSEKLRAAMRQMKDAESEEGFEYFQGGKTHAQ